MPDGTCSISDCDRDAKQRGWCMMHYKRWWRTGDPLKIRPIRGPAEGRFWSRVTRGDGCWLWTGAQNENDYGNFCLSSGVWVSAHRYSWELANGPILDGSWVLHHCDNPPCVRPDHLFLGTPLANVEDMIAKRRHMHGERHWRATLTDDQIAEIRSRLTGRRGELAALAREFGTTRAMVQHIKLGDRRIARTHFVE